MGISVLSALRIWLSGRKHPPPALAQEREGSNRMAITESWRASLFIGLRRNLIAVNHGAQENQCLAG
jgi:hypothetical protein